MPEIKCNLMTPTRYIQRRVKLARKSLPTLVKAGVLGEGMIKFIGESLVKVEYNQATEEDFRLMDLAIQEGDYNARK